MIITHKFQVRTGRLRLYVIGSPLLVKCASETTFSELGWSAKWDKRNILTHYPGGWLDRADSACARAININPFGNPSSDEITITLYKTSNPGVTLLRSTIYLKSGWLNKKKQEQRLNSFFESLETEFRKNKLPLVTETEWDALVVKASVFKCSPSWGRHQDGTLIYDPIPTP